MNKRLISFRFTRFIILENVIDVSLTGSAVFMQQAAQMKSSDYINRKGPPMAFLALTGS